MQELTAHTSSSSLWLEIGSINNTLTALLLEEMAAALDEAEKDPLVKSVVVTGSGTHFFSPGLNLHEVSVLSPSEMRRFMGLFQGVCLRLVSYSKPTAAAVNGHALAGGFLLASCCGIRVAVEGTRAGLTPLTKQVGIPRLNEQILSTILGSSATRRLLAEGSSWTATEAFKHGWADSVVPFDRLEPEIGSLSLEPVAKSNRNSQGLIDLAPAALEAGLDQFIAHWSAPETQHAIKQATLRLT